ncbi:hypothetical protein [Blastococcus litoris]|uniref:hypothetical protein n=1 Tax=Blastococcus litoris TaxID=2171622 RepID=UPI0013E08DFE|nr:hypothetical protein [Blastococcus litoris]
MEIPVAAGPWLVLGVVLGLLLPLLAAAAVLLARRRGAAAPAGEPDPGGDDLPGFLESPPGTGPAPAAAEGWAALGPPAPPAHPAPVRDDGTRRALAAMGATALVLVGAVATVAAVGGADDAGRSDRDPAPPPATTAQLAFEGVVLERHPVGVTVAYPRVEVTVRDGRAAAEVELPTWNCLRDSAPADPVVAGCSRSVVEHAELASPALALETHGDALTVSGSFPAFRRSNGSAPAPTGRVYEIAVEVAPRDGTADGGSEPATGSLTLGDERAVPSEAGRNEITAAG